MHYAYQSARLQLIWCILYGDCSVLYSQHLNNILDPGGQPEASQKEYRTQVEVGHGVHGQC
jgi:hypothetical protein